MISVKGDKRPVSNNIREDIQRLRNPEKAKILSGFFKTGKGQYGEGDIFLGISVPEQRKIAKKYSDLPLKDLHKLLSNRIHEYRLIALLILIGRYRSADETEKRNIFNLYLKNTQYINNWDLVDLSAPNIIGDYLLKRDRSILYRLAQSENLWERRIAVISTFAFIKADQFDDTFLVSELLLHDRHDLIHKAAGWMLREIGKRDQQKEEIFLRKYAAVMPRTMLRYAVERFDSKKRLSYLDLKKKQKS
ncbi:MAG: DNA alkylation repair protein [Nitrospira sp.]|nr:DNA alkylation repair protein [Nitrospira sp.]